MDDLKKETIGYKVAQLTKELDNLDCIVCPDLKLKGTGRGIVWHCANEDLLVCVRTKRYSGGLPAWCPRAKALKRTLKELGYKEGE